MGIIDKKNILGTLRSRENVILELGCGDRKRRDDAIGIDVLDAACVDIVGDIFEVLEKIPDESVHGISSYHFIEHVEDIALLMKHMGRVLKPSGSLDVVVPHFANPYFYSDWTHKRPFGLYTFSYFAHDRVFKRRVPHYDQDILFELVEVELVFKSFPPYYFRHAVKMAIGKLLTLNRYLQEFYEENLCYLWPCYEIRYKLRRS